MVRPFFANHVAQEGVFTHLPLCTRPTLANPKNNGCLINFICIVGLVNEKKKKKLSLTSIRESKQFYDSSGSEMLTVDFYVI